MLPKNALRIDPTYQRDVAVDKVSAITAAWSWVSLGAIVVGERQGQYWVIDGQHRVLASMRRSDITHLPCVVFQTADVKEEAKGFLNLNTGRKPVTAIGKQKALVAAGDEVAVFVHAQLEMIGLTVVQSPKAARQIKAVAWCMKRAAENKESFQVVLRLAVELSDKDSAHVAEKLLEALWFINQRIGLSDKRLVARMKEKGASELIAGANRAAAYYTSGGGKVWAEGMLAEINKGLRIKFTMDEATP